MNVSSGTGLPGLSRIKGRKTVVVVVVVVVLRLVVFICIFCSLMHIMQSNAVSDFKMHFLF